MNVKLITILCLALGLSGVLFGCSTTDRHRAEYVSVPEIKITFAKRRVAPPSGDLPHDAKYPPGFDSNVYGALTNIVAGRISALTVTWADSKRFKTEGQTADFLRELLSSTNTQTWTYHVWSYGDGVPSVLATVEHTVGKKGKWLIWSSPNVAWAYQDGSGKWWWGLWDYKSPKPKSLETGSKS